MEISESKTHFDDELDKSLIKTSNIMLHKLSQPCWVVRFELQIAFHRHKTSTTRRLHRIPAVGNLI